MLKRTTYTGSSQLTFFYNWIVLKMHTNLHRTFILLISTYFLIACSLGESTDISTGSNSDPVLSENPVAFIKRPLPVDDNNEVEGDDLREPSLFVPGAALYIKNSASPTAGSSDISSIAFSDAAFLNEDGELLYDVKDLNVSYDGKKLLFAMRAPDIENADDEDQPKWNIWEYDQELSSLRRIITGNDTAESGHDISPSYLPDGRILFTSTRQSRSRAILLDEGKGQYAAQDEARNSDAFVLHVMSDDGSDIEQITFNQSHDINPTVLENGKILFSRWDNASGTSNNGLNLYQINPDGSGLTYMYGRHSHDSGSDGSRVQFVKPRELENGNILVQLREFETDNFASQPTVVNVNDFVENDVSVDGMGGVGQSAIISGLNTDGELSLNGSYGSFFPLYDGTNRYLVSWSVCRVALIDSDASTDGDQTGEVEACTTEKINSDAYDAAIPFYGLWVLDADSNTQRPIDLPEAGQIFHEAVLMTARPLPTFIAPMTLSSDAQVLADQGFGAIHIRSVYDFDGVDGSSSGLAVMSDPILTAPGDRLERFIRIEKAVSLPSDDVYDFNNTAFGVNNNRFMREILGYTPIEPDGSVKVVVPANVAFGISILDEKGQRIGGRHQNWLQVAPGETVECIGCHTGDSDVPHGRADAEPDSINTGAVTSGIPFPNTNPFFQADMGLTMAETFELKNVTNETRRLTPDIVFDDEWTDPDPDVIAATSTSPAESFSYAYSDLQTTPPINEGCATNWTSLCRVTINYEDHIHPLWSVDRGELVVVEDEVEITGNSCASCHSNVDDMDLAQVPFQQLDLSDGVSDLQADHFKSYQELLSGDSAIELVAGILQNIQVDTGEIQMVPEIDENGDFVLDEDGNQVEVPRLIGLLDDDGEPVLDIDGNPILVTVPVTVDLPVTQSMRAAGARNSTVFMNRFDVDESHAGFLSSAELKLISEWLDLGARYYNNPFDAPAN
jgi:hypothetical protein